VFRKNFNLQSSIYNLLLFVILSCLLGKIYAEANLKPISFYTDFQIVSKSSNQLNVEITNFAYQNNDGLDKIIDEFKNGSLPYIYQSKLIAIPENGNVQITVKSYDSIIIPNREIANTAQTEQANDKLPIAYLGQSGTMRDFKIVPLNIRQYYYDKTTKNIICYNRC